MQMMAVRPARQAASRLGRDIGVALAMILAALGMAHDHIGGAGILQHLGARYRR